MNSLAETYYAQGKSAKAEALFRQVLDVRRRVLGPEHPATLYTHTDLVCVYANENRFSMAEPHAAQALAGRRRIFGPNNPDTMFSAQDLALAYIGQGKFAESEPLAREALDYGRKEQADDWRRFRAESLLGASLAGQKKYVEAQPLLIEGYAGLLKRKEQIDDPDKYILNRTREWIVRLYSAWGKPEKAAEWRHS
jgi:tetratricopeptide (TPR) repeat protein